MIIKAIEVEFEPLVEVGLTEGEVPLNFIKQGTEGLFLWYKGFEINPPGIPAINHKFHFVGKGQFVDPLWQHFGTVKVSKYYQVFKE